MGDLRRSVEAAVSHMSWLQPADRAAVDLALTYADRIDEALATGEGQEVTKALYLGPHLLKTLAELGGTPAGRKALEIREEAGGKLAQLRAIRGAEQGKPKARRSRSA